MGWEMDASMYQTWSGMSPRALCEVPAAVLEQFSDVSEYIVLLVAHCHWGELLPWTWYSWSATCLGRWCVLERRNKQCDCLKAPEMTRQVLLQGQNNSFYIIKPCNSAFLCMHTIFI